LDIDKKVSKSSNSSKSVIDIAQQASIILLRQ